MKPTLEFRPKRRDIPSPASATSAGKPASARSATPRNPTPKPILAALVTESRTNAVSAPAGTSEAAKPGASGALSPKSVAKVVRDVTKGIQERNGAAKPQSRAADLKALQARLKPLLSKSEFREMTALFARLERQREANKKAQAAWRERQKAK